MAKAIKKYTVIGIYEDNHQPWATFVKAKSPIEAASFGVEDMIKLNEPVDQEDRRYIAGNLLVVSVIEGHHVDRLGSEEMVPGHTLV